MATPEMPSVNIYQIHVKFESGQEWHGISTSDYSDPSHKELVERLIRQYGPMSSIAFAGNAIDPTPKEK